MKNEGNINTEAIVDKLRSVEPDTYSLEAKPGKVGKNADTAVIVLAGGKGSRMGDVNSLPKQLLPIGGKPVLAWSLDTFDSVEDIGCIVVVCPKDDYQTYIDQVVDPFKFTTPILFAPAGTVRQESAFNGVECVPDKYSYVMIHDAARPLVPASMIRHLHSVMKAEPELDGAICAHQAIDTLKVVQDNKIVGTPDRSAFWVAQTPQCFKLQKYKMAHISALRDGFVGPDDSTLIERIGGNVACLEGKRNNIKLTVPEDYLVLSGVIDYMKLEHGSDYEV